MAEGQPMGLPVAAAAVPANTKREAPNPLVSARTKLAKAQQEQLDAESRLQEAHEKMQVRAAEVVKAKRKELVNKAYQTAWLKIQICLRERLCADSTRLGCVQELDDLLAGKRPAGSTTYLFRWCLKKAKDPVDDMLVLECVMRVAGPDDAAEYAGAQGYQRLVSHIYLEYKGQRALFNEYSSLRTLVTFAYQSEDGSEANELSEDQLCMLCNDTLTHLTQDVIQMSEVLRHSSVQPFCAQLNFYYQWIMSEVRVFKAAVSPQ